MATSRFREDRPRSPRTTAGQVYAAILADPWAKDKLEEIYRKVFEAGGVRKSETPDHFVYVTPSRARTEINELSSWLVGRFGEPAGTVPAKTPVGYLSGKFDGWVTYFAMLLSSGDESLEADFRESTSGAYWAAPPVSRVQSGGMSGLAPVVLPASAASSGSTAPATAAPSRGKGIVDKVVERIFGAEEDSFASRSVPAPPSVAQERVADEDTSVPERTDIPPEYRELLSDEDRRVIAAMRPSRGLTRSFERVAEGLQSRDPYERASAKVSADLRRRAFQTDEPVLAGEADVKLRQEMEADRREWQAVQKEHERRFATKTLAEGGMSTADVKGLSEEDKGLLRAGRQIARAEARGKTAVPLAPLSQSDIEAARTEEAVRLALAERERQEREKQQSLGRSETTLLG